MLLLISFNFIFKTILCNYQGFLVHGYEFSRGACNYLYRQIHVKMNLLQYHFFFFCLFRATPRAYGSSQARGSIGAAAAGLCTTVPNHIYDLHCSSPQCRILNLLSEARDQTHILMDTSQIRFC